MDKLKEKVKTLPDLPGVYLIKNQRHKVIYVGKASSLRKRVLSYFSLNLTPAKHRMMKEAVSIDYIISSNEAAALLLEAALIKEIHPRYNIELKDDKSYPYIEISKEDYPYLRITRHKRKDALYFGPYAKASLLKEALSLLRKIFPFRSCRHLPLSACLFHDLHLCPAPCVEKIDKKLYRQNLKSIIMILEGKRKHLAGLLEKRMKEMAKKLKFEEAEQLKHKLRALESLYLPQDEMLEVVNLKEELCLKHLPLHIETFDISNFSGRESTGSVVVFLEGRPQRNMYRRFRIKTNSADDISMMVEVVQRRITRLQRENKKPPDLLVLDGGQAHVKAISKLVEDLGEKIEVVGLAKRGRDKVWLPQHPEPLYLPSGSGALRLLQRTRDEAHRFARRYHLWLRNERFYG